ncbi:MAG: hypothetical protein ACKVP3_23705 [Hyphomicrobiaceae bacterium]
MDRLTDLKAREEEVAREWEWLNDTINRVAQLRAEDSETQAFRILQEQVRLVGQRRVELMMEVAHLEQRADDA